MTRPASEPAAAKPGNASLSSRGALVGYPELLALFRECGEVDQPTADYMKTHFARYAFTRDEFLATWDWRGRRLLDIGALHLHQSLLFKLAGFEVTATDLPMLVWPQIRTAADRHGIRLAPCANLACPVELEALPADSFDVILFSEIIEHITFNPVRMWKALYRLLAPGGRIVVTTPSVYSLQGPLLDLARWRRRMGVGIRVEEILQYVETVPHWKEFSAKELQRYFRLLSKDFAITKALHVDGMYDEPWKGWKLRGARFLKRHIPPLRQNIHLEVELTSRGAGIDITPGWGWVPPDYSIP